MDLVLCGQCVLWYDAYLTPFLMFKLRELVRVSKALSKYNKGWAKDYLQVSL